MKNFLFPRGGHIKKFHSVETRTKFVPVALRFYVTEFCLIAFLLRRKAAWKTNIVGFRQMQPFGLNNKKQHPPSHLRWEGVVFNEVRKKTVRRWWIFAKTSRNAGADFFCENSTSNTWSSKMKEWNWDTSGTAGMQLTCSHWKSAFGVKSSKWTNEPKFSIHQTLHCC